MNVEPRVIRALALDTTRSGWDTSTKRLPTAIRHAARKAADEVPLGSPTGDGLAGAVLAARAKALAFIAVGFVFVGVGIYEAVTTPEDKVAGWIAVGVFVVGLLLTCGYAASIWGRSPALLWSQARRRALRRQTVREVRDLARTLDPAGAPAQGTLVPTPSPLLDGAWFRPRLGVVSPREAEEMAAEAMMTLGAPGSASPRQRGMAGLT